MAENQSEGIRVTAQGAHTRRMLRRRKVVLGVALLLAIVIVCVTAIGFMLQRLESRNASFQPPMTALERQRLLPPDPVLDAAPRLDGLRYRQQVERKVEGYAPVDVERADVQGPLSPALMLDGGNLHADAHSGLRPGMRSQ
ncbi:MULTISPECIES: hypothetical protein [unclassified Pseudomonas]|uniref:hypothetical protein n=1 Tax=unclassified Pseudomonas TaxID=196821 RepID=UPI0025D70689|nr:MULTISPECIES: hypothetical protein [unclassified Pseudomonas]